MKRTLLLVSAVLSTTAWCGGAGEQPGFAAHEWGTFTSVQGADGVQLEWNPLVKTDLPSFVYDQARLAAEGCVNVEIPEKAAVSAQIRMETPVIYFYSPVERVVDVRVEFPQGQMTEWYPRASGFGPFVSADAAQDTGAGRSFLEWNGARILPPGTGEIAARQLIRGKGENHYYAARETRANLVSMQAGEGSGLEYDRFLFYRGVGGFQAPLSVKVSGDETQLELSTTSAEPLTDLFALTINAGKARYARAAGVSADKPERVNLSGGNFEPLPQVRERLMAEIRAALVKQGLYEDEAAAMVNTWKDQWFAEEGTRVLYLLPRGWTDRILPLRIEPKPAELVRVMVGRSEVILPGVERELRQQIARYSSGEPELKRVALEAVRELGLGRFLAPAVTRALAAEHEQKLTEPAWDLARAAVNLD